MTENEIQRAIFKHLRQRGAPGVFAFHPRNSGMDQRALRRRGINSGLGVVSGVPDVIVIKPIHSTAQTGWGQVFALELKTATGKVGPAQTEVLERMQQAGVTVGVARGLDEALRWLEGHDILRGRAA